MKKFAIAALLAVSAFSANAGTELIINGDFETGDFTGWTRTGNLSLSDVISNTTTSNHTFLWRSGATGTPAFISQDVATAAGGLYTLAFDVYSAGTSTTDPTAVNFEVDFGGTQVYGFTNQTLPWTHVVLTNLQASSLLTEIKFGSRNDPSFTRLDNISVQAVPEPETYAMMLAGLGLLGFLARHKRIVPHA